MVMGKFQINTKLERQKLLRPKYSNINLDKLAERNHEFQLELANKFGTLNDEWREQNLDTWNQETIDIIQETALNVAGRKSKDRVSKLSDSTRKLIGKRRQMKMDSQGTDNIEYRETCKTIRKKIREDVRHYNTKMIHDTIENNRSIKKTNKKLGQGTKKINKLLDSNGQEITDQDDILRRIEKFYEELYQSNQQTGDIGDSQEKLPKVECWEVEYALSQMKRGKAPGQYNIMMDTLNEAGDAVNKELAKLFTACLHQGKVPQKWKDANMIILHTKGDKRDLKNYRPISLLSNIYKLFTKILTNRLERLLDDNQPREQAGFRRNFSTIDHIHTLNQLKEKCQEFNIPVCVVFVDYEKAFDSVETWAVLEALIEQEINPNYIKVIKDIYTGSTTTVKLHKESNKIPIRKGVRQGDTISPKLFTACLEHIFKDINWEDKGISVNGEKFNHLRFADDIVIIANNFNEMESMLQDLDIASRKRGLKMNMKKTKVMADQSVKHKPIIINGTELEHVSEYIYLGQRFTLTERNQDNEIRRRIKAGWQAFADTATS
ncbi:endonuclease-reverse transcriptase [Apostichopus japonicus]|uniref:Endonuclease-reverse transcriptase n=1 Tax=Stichopus japonicus TaxID=307972 RepID=A0A2G8L2C7_STIJA|nr:endonuclease-reverse transcriptase [Apostichopus japonicus]